VLSEYVLVDYLHARFLGALQPRQYSFSPELTDDGRGLLPLPPAIGAS
jgi:hypothetical protein